jgi:hypothetical protein
VLNLVVHCSRTVEVEDSGALSEAQRALATVPSNFKQPALLMPALRKS